LQVRNSWGSNSWIWSRDRVRALASIRLAERLVCEVMVLMHDGI
jgi:hypothetical protein